MVGDGSLLHHAAILCTSDVGDPGPKVHLNSDYPIIVAGSAGGALQTGLHVRSADKGSTTRVLLTLLRAMGLPFAQFGEGPNRVSEGLREIEA
jgi:hypothetical protein